MQLNLSKIGIRSSEFGNPASIKNLIFDFGGVICNIDIKLTEKAFMNLGLKKFDSERSFSDSVGIFEDIETGTITPQNFRNKLRPHFETPVTDEQIDIAWNTLLLDIPDARIRLIEGLRKYYRIFLLSNSNEIHYLKYLENFRDQFGYADFDALFEKAYFSFRVGLKKPSLEIFRYVLQDCQLDPSETLFIDDTQMHVEGARNAGINAYHLDVGKGEEIMDLFL